MILAFASTTINGPYQYLARIKWCLHMDELFCESMISVDAFFLLFSILPVFFSKVSGGFGSYGSTVILFAFFLSRMIPFQCNGCLWTPTVQLPVSPPCHWLISWDGYAAECMTWTLNTTTSFYGSATHETTTLLHPLPGHLPWWPPPLRDFQCSCGAVNEAREIILSTPLRCIWVS